MNRRQAAEAVLEAARQAITQEAVDQFSGFSDKQRPLIPLLLSLLDSTQAVASAIADNAWDDHEPINRDFVRGCKQQTNWIASELGNATECPNRANWEIAS